MKEQKHKELMSSLKGMKDQELAAREQQLTEELFWLKFKHGSGQLDKTSGIKKTRKMIARVKTVANQQKAAGKGKAS